MKLNEGQKTLLESERKRYKSIRDVNPENPYDILGAKFMLEVINFVVLLHNAGVKYDNEHPKN